jgi:hypothetical protein
VAVAPSLRSLRVLRVLKVLNLDLEAVMVAAAVATAARNFSPRIFPMSAVGIKKYVAMVEKLTLSCVSSRASQTLSLL